MKSIKEKILEISNDCLENIKRNIIEKKETEAIGDIIIKEGIILNQQNNKVIAINAYPWIMSKTTHEWAYLNDQNGNESSRKRIWNLDKQKREKNLNWNPIMGQYHSHIYQNGKYPSKIYEYNKKRYYLYKDDAKFFRDIMKNYLEIDESLQIIISVKRKKYNGKINLPTQTIRHYKKKLRIKERIKKPLKSLDGIAVNGLAEIEEYDMIFGAYILTQKKFFEIPIIKKINGY